MKRLLFSLLLLPLFCFSQRYHVGQQVEITAKTPFHLYLAKGIVDRVEKSGEFYLYKVCGYIFFETELKSVDCSYKIGDVVTVWRNQLYGTGWIEEKATITDVQCCNPCAYFLAGMAVPIGEDDILEVIIK